MKGIEFIGTSLEVVREFPVQAKREAGHELDRVQRGFDPTDWKPMKAIGPGVREIRIKQEGQYRVVYVLHAFQKKTQKTSKLDIEAAKRSLQKVIKRQRS